MREKISSRWALDHWHRWADTVGLLLFLLAVAFTHLPFFTFLPVPGIGPDTFQYVKFAERIMALDLPVTDHPIDLPVGLPLFTALILSLGGNMVTVVAVQTLLYAVCGSVLIRSMRAVTPQGSFWASMGMVLFTLRPQTIFNNLFIYTESLFTSALMLMAAFVVTVVLSDGRKGWSGLALSIAATMLVRSNGLVVLPIIALLTGWTMWRRKSLKTVAWPALTLILGLSVISVLNWHVKDRLAFIDVVRVDKVVKVQTDPSTNHHRPEGRMEMFRSYLGHFTAGQPSFYFRLHRDNVYYFNQLRRAYETGEPSGVCPTIYGSPYCIEDQSPTVMETVFGNFPMDKTEVTGRHGHTNFNNRPRKPDYLAVHYASEAVFAVGIPWLLHLSFWMTTATVLFLLVRGTYNHGHLALGLLALLYFAFLFSLPLAHGRYLGRYISVAEFAVCILGVLGTVLLLRYKLRRPLHDAAAD